MNINLTLIGQTITFIVFVWFCMKYIWPPIMEVLEARKTRIADGLAAAEEGNRARAQAEQHATEVLGEARGKASEIIAGAERRRAEIVEAAKGEARNEGARIIASARTDIDTEFGKAKEQLRTRVGELAVAGAGQILGREVDASAHADLLDKLAAKL